MNYLRNRNVWCVKQIIDTLLKIYPLFQRIINHVVHVNCLNDSYSLQPLLLSIACPHVFCFEFFVGVSENPYKSASGYKNN